MRARTERKDEVKLLRIRAVKSRWINILPLNQLGFDFYLVIF